MNVCLDLLFLDLGDIEFMLLFAMFYSNSFLTHHDSLCLLENEEPH